MKFWIKLIKNILYLTNNKLTRSFSDNNKYRWGFNWHNTITVIYVRDGLSDLKHRSSFKKYITYLKITL